MYLYGTGYQDLVLSYYTSKEEFSLVVFVINETVIQISSQNSGYGFV